MWLHRPDRLLGIALAVLVKVTWSSYKHLRAQWQLGGAQEIEGGAHAGRHGVRARATEKMLRYHIQR